MVLDLTPARAPQGSENGRRHHILCITRSHENRRELEQRNRMLVDLCIRSFLGVNRQISPIAFHPLDTTLLHSN
jgi:hypothetical protein